MAKIKLAIDLSGIDRLRARPDFQQNATRALARRLYYRMRWAATEKPWRLKLGEDLEVLAPKGGAGALIYYMGYSEPETAAFVRNFLKPGMVFWDVGAHIGEYSLLAARQVGPEGKVEAIEPQPAIRHFLKTNVELNGFQNIRVHGYAASAQRGEATLVLSEEPSMAHLTNGGNSNVRAGSRPASKEVRVPDDLAGRVPQFHISDTSPYKGRCRRRGKTRSQRSEFIALNRGRVGTRVGNGIFAC